MYGVRTILLISGLFFGFQAQAGDIHADSTQNWKAHGVFAAVIAESADLFPGVELENYQGMDLLDDAATKCSGEFVRPGYLADARSTATNYVECDLVNKDGSTGHLYLPLGYVPFEAWGNRPSENYWEREGLPKPFQALTRQDFRGDFNQTMFKALEKLSKKKHPHLEYGLICGPYGVLCTGSHTLLMNPEARWPEMYMECSIDTEGSKIYQTRCVFQFPEEL